MEPIFRSAKGWGARWKQGKPMFTAKSPAAIITPIRADHHCKRLPRFDHPNQPFNLSRARIDNEGGGRHTTAKTRRFTRRKDSKKNAFRLTARVTGGWREQSSKTENCQSSETTQKTRRVPAVRCTLCWANFSWINALHNRISSLDNSCLGFLCCQTLARYSLW
jgi:hypothetical protein